MSLILHDYLSSGNGCKVRLVLRRLGLPFTLVEHDIPTGGTRTPEFRALNPNGRVPVLVLEDGTALAGSNAILWYLGEGTNLVPLGRLPLAQVLQGMFFAQYSHEPHVAEGGVDLSAYPPVGARLDRVAGEPGHVPITWRP